MSIQDLNHKISKLHSDVQTLMTGSNVDAEARTKADAMLSEAETLKADRARLEASAPEERSSKPAIPRGNAGSAEVEAETRTVEQRKEAASVALRAYIKGEKFEQRDLTVLADGIMIPVDVAQPNVATKSAGYIYNLVKKMSSSSGSPIKVPFLNDTAEGFVLESASITTTDPTVAGATLTVDGMRSNPILLDNNLIADSGFDLIQYVVDAIQVRYLSSISNAITNGNGSNIQGLVGNVTSVATTAVAATLDYASIVQLVTKIDPSYAIGSVLTLNTDTLSKILNIVDQNKRPIFTAFNDGGISGFSGAILGYPVKINPYMPNVVSAATPIIFGNYNSGYLLNEIKPGIRILKLAERYAELNRFGVVAFARVAGAVTDSGTHPLVSLTVL